MFAITFSALVNGRRHTGTYEMDMDRMTRNCVVSDILSGQFDNVDRVIEFDPDDHACEDITDDIARDIAGQLSSQGSAIPEHLREWMHEHHGIYACRSLDYAATGEAA